MTVSEEVWVAVLRDMAIARKAIGKPSKKTIRWCKEFAARVKRRTK